MVRHLSRKAAGTEWRPAKRGSAVCNLQGNRIRAARACWGEQDAMGPRCGMWSYRTCLPRWISVLLCSHPSFYAPLSPCGMEVLSLSSLLGSTCTYIDLTPVSGASGCVCVHSWTSQHLRSLMATWSMRAMPWRVFSASLGALLSQQGSEVPSTSLENKRPPQSHLPRPV